MKVKIVNAKGLHARASAKLAELCERFESDIEICHDGICVDGRSIMGLMMLGAGLGSEVEINTQGQDAEKALEAIASLIADYFGEGG